MSREIKFRAWSIKKRKYIDIDTLYCANGKVCGIVCDGIVYDAEDVVLEQDTGLKDKNGKEIYVGDIVSEHNGDIIGEITQKRSGEYCIAWIGIFGGSSVLYDELSMCEVIGDIHENPELLGENK